MMILILSFIIIYAVSIIGILYIDYLWLKEFENNDVRFIDVVKFSHPYTYIPVINTILFITIFLK